MKHKHGTKQRKISHKLHIGVNDDGNIIAGEVTTLRDSDIRAVSDLLDQTTTQVNAVVGDGADELFGGYSFCWTQKDAKLWKEKRDAMCAKWTFSTDELGKEKKGANCA